MNNNTGCSISYIDKIRKHRRFNHTTLNDEDDWGFEGYGQGNFEELCSDASEKALLDYIEHCKEQIALAEEYLKIKKGDLT